MSLPRFHMNFKKLAIALMVIFLWSSSPNLAALAPQDSTRDKALLDAVEKGDRQRVLALLAQGANVNAKGINDTALETAIFQQDVEMVRLLVDKGAKIEAGDLGNAAHGLQGDKAKANKIVELLLDKGAALGACVEQDDASGGEAAAERSAQPGSHCTKTAGEEALRAAATSDNLAVMHLLLAKSVRVDGRDRFGNSVLMEVVLTDSIDAVQA